MPNHGTGKEKMNYSNKKSPTLASLLAWGKTLRNSCSEYEEHHYCFLFAAKLRGCCPNSWDRHEKNLLNPKIIESVVKPEYDSAWFTLILTISHVFVYLIIR